VDDGKGSWPDIRRESFASWLATIAAKLKYSQAVYQSLIHLSWIDKLVDNVKTLFTSLYREQFTIPLTSKIECPFDEYFNRQIQELETTDAGLSAQSVDSEVDVLASAPLDAEEHDTLAPPPPMPVLHRSWLRQCKKNEEKR